VLIDRETGNAGKRRDMVPRNGSSACGDTGQRWPLGIRLAEQGAAVCLPGWMSPVGVRR
jgi:hypothetical protein